MNAFRIMDRRWDYEWGLALVALFLIWRGFGNHRRTAAHSIPRERRAVVRAHGRRRGDWVTRSSRAGWAMPTLARLPEAVR